MACQNEESHEIRDGTRRRLEFRSASSSVSSCDEVSWSPPEEGFYPSDSATAPLYFEAIYCGTLPLPNVASCSISAVVPWIIEELAQEAKDKESAEIFLRVHDGSLRGIEQTRGRVIFDHPVANLSSFARSKLCSNTFSYLLRDATTGYVSCSVFELPEYDQVLSLFFAIRDQSSKPEVPRKSLNSSVSQYSYPSANLHTPLPESVSVPASFSSVLSAICSSATSRKRRPSSISAPESLSGFSHFEVLFVGRVEISEPRKSTDYKALVDEAVSNFNQQQTDQLCENSIPKRPGARARKWSFESLPEEEEPVEEEVFPNRTSPSGLLVPQQIRKSSAPPDAAFTAQARLSIPSSSSFFAHLSPGKTSIAIRKAGVSPTRSPHKDSQEDYPISDCKSQEKSSSRAMLLLIGTKEVRLISLDKKATLLCRSILDISTIIQGFKYTDHVGFMCNDVSTPVKQGLVTYVVKCQSAAIADSVMQSMKTAFYGGLVETKECSIPHEGPSLSKGNHPQHLCQHCPLFQFANLCRDLEGLEPLRAHSLILERIGQLDACDQERIIVEYKSLCEKRSLLDDIPEEEEKSSSPRVKLSSGNLARRNVALMALLRSLCASSQALHDESQTNPSCNSPPRVNLSGNSPPRPRSSSVGMEGLNKLLVLRDKARKSLSNSLENIGKKSEEIAGNLIDRLNGDESPKKTKSGKMGSPSPLSSPSGATFNFDTPDERASLHADSPLSSRPRSRTIGDEIHKSSKSPNSPKFNLLSRLQEGATPAKKTLSALGASFEHQESGVGPLNRSYHSALRTPLTNSSAALSMAQETSLTSPRKRRMSWRQAIFSRVVSPRLNSRASIASLSSCLPPGYDLAHLSSDSRRSSCLSMVTVSSGLSNDGRRGSIFYKSLWKKAIMEQILQNRLQQQDRLKEEELEKLRQMKLNYEEITPCPEEVVRPRWESYMAKAENGSVRLDRVLVEDALKAGIPRDMRFEVWNFLKDQHELDKRALIRMENAPPYCYRQLLKELTSYQHAILIDLGRTFPSHPYFAQPLGPGQLSLFNILKAYSLYDPEVGYCQGLSFIAGALLLHMDEEDAFDMLVCLMFRFGLRKQFRPDMLALQIYMYQLSRLVHDRHKDLHTHLEEHEIPMLYAAPWFLTLFASTFPLGFVSRVFDFIFFSGGIDVVFKVALVLLGEHKELIKQCDSFESINDFLKSTLPGMSIIQMERIFNAVMEFDLNRELLAYEVEYHVLQEEMLASPAPNLSQPPVYDQGGSPDVTKRGQHTSNRRPKIEEDSDSGSSISAWEMEKLETAKKNLKRQNMELLEQLQQAHSRVQLSEQNRSEVEQRMKTSENQVETYKCKAQSLESRVDALELERKSLLNMVEDLRRRMARKEGTTLNGESPMCNGLSNGVSSSRHDSDDSGLEATPASNFRSSLLKNSV